MDLINPNLTLEILNASYWEHYKVAKDMALYLPITHPKRIKIENEINELVKKIHALKQKT